MKSFASHCRRSGGSCAAAALYVLLGFGQQGAAQSKPPMAGPQPAIADESSEPSAQPAAAPSIILQLDDAGTTYKSRLDAARKAFHDVSISPQLLGKLQTAEKNYRDKPGDPHVAAAYADAFSEALQAFDESLRTFMQSQEELTKAHDAFVRSTQAAIEAVKKESARHAKSEQDSVQQAQEMETALDAIAAEYRDAINKGESLPPEIDRQVVRLSGMIEQRQIARQLHAERAKRSARNQLKLEASLSGGQRAMDQMTLRFEKAEGDLFLIGEIAQAKADELTPDPVSFDEDGDDILVVDLKPFLNFGTAEPEADPKDKSVAVEPQSLGGAELLRARLRKQAPVASTRPSTTTAKK